MHMQAYIKRIIIMGAAGTGKTTLANRIAKDLALPLIHLDREFWLPNYQKPDPQEWMQRVNKLARADKWVMDGNYLDTIEYRVKRAHAMIWLDLPQWLYVTRILYRTAYNYGKERYDLGEGLPQRFNKELIRNAFRYPRVRRPRMLELVERAQVSGVKVIVLSSKKELDLFLSSHFVESKLN